ncbi:hypothetical protein R6Q57_003180 [Mikania cordata]
MDISTEHRTNREPEPWRDLTGTIVMVTGASSGIGREFCIDLAKSGCRIIAAARRTDRLKSLCDQINNANQIEARHDDDPAVEGIKQSELNRTTAYGTLRDEA